MVWQSGKVWQPFPPEPDHLRSFENNECLVGHAFCCFVYQSVQSSSNSLLFCHRTWHLGMHFWYLLLFFSHLFSSVTCIKQSCHDLEKKCRGPSQALWGLNLLDKVAQYVLPKRKCLQWFSAVVGVIRSIRSVYYRSILGIRHTGNVQIL